MPSVNEEDVSSDDGDIAATLIVGAAGGVLVGGALGSLGKWTLAFFNPGFSNVSNFATFTGVGAIAFPLVTLSTLFSNHYMNKSEYLKSYPNLHSFLINAIDLVVALAAVTAAAAIVGSPIIPTVACTMLIPTIAYVLGMIACGVNAFLPVNKESKSAQATDAPAMA